MAGRAWGGAGGGSLERERWGGGRLADGLNLALQTELQPWLLGGQPGRGGGRLTTASCCRAARSGLPHQWCPCRWPAPAQTWHTKSPGGSRCRGWPAGACHRQGQRRVTRPPALAARRQDCSKQRRPPYRSLPHDAPYRPAPPFALSASEAHPRRLPRVHQDGPGNGGHRGGCHPDGREDAAPRVGVVAQHLQGSTQEDRGGVQQGISVQGRCAAAATTQHATHFEDRRCGPVQGKQGKEGKGQGGQASPVQGWAAHGSSIRCLHTTCRGETV